jgi:hypothetical protein
MKRRLGLRMAELGLKLVMSRLRHTLARKSWFLRVSFYYSRISFSPKGTISQQLPVLGTRGPSQVTRVLNFASTKQGVLVQTVQQL